MDFLFIACVGRIERGSGESSPGGVGRFHLDTPIRPHLAWTPKSNRTSRDSASDSDPHDGPCAPYAGCTPQRAAGGVAAYLDGGEPCGIIFFACLAFQSSIALEQRKCIPSAKATPSPE